MKYKRARGGAVSMNALGEKHMEYSDFIYVFWVKTGLEEKAAEEIKTAFNDEVTLLQLYVERFFRKQGKVKKVIYNAFPSYVLIVTKISNEQFIIRARECVCKSNAIIRLLCYGDTDEAAMHEGERAAIDHLWQDKNCIEVSTGFFEGDHIVITEGHFKGRESVIKELHPRSRQAIVEIEFLGGIRQMTVGMEIIKKL